MRSKNTAIILGLAASLAAPTYALAQADEGDIGLRVEGGRIVTNLVGEGGDDNPYGGPERRIFLGELGLFEVEDGGDPDVFSPPPTGSGTENFVTNTPGFDSAAGTFAPGSSIGLNIFTPQLLSENVVRYDTDSDTLVSTPVEIQAFFSSPRQLGRTNQPADTQSLFLPVFDSNEGDGDGRFHRHYNFALFDGSVPPGSQGELTPPSDPGVYVLEADLFTNQAGLGGSDPFLLVFGFQTSEADVQEAAAFLASNVVPEPTGLAVLALGGLGLLRRRR